MQFYEDDSKEQVLERVEIMKAAAELKQIQIWHSAEGWMDCKFVPSFDFFRNKYRIKPELMRVYAVTFQSGTIRYFQNETLANDFVERALGVLKLTVLEEVNQE